MEQKGDKAKKKGQTEECPRYIELEMRANNDPDYKSEKRIATSYASNCMWQKNFEKQFSKLYWADLRILS